MNTALEVCWSRAEYDPAWVPAHATTLSLAIHATQKQAEGTAPGWAAHAHALLRELRALLPPAAPGEHLYLNATVRLAPEGPFPVRTSVVLGDHAPEARAALLSTDTLNAEAQPTQSLRIAARAALFVRDAALALRSGQKAPYRWACINLDAATDEELATLAAPLPRGALAFAHPKQRALAGLLLRAREARIQGSIPRALDMEARGDALHLTLPSSLRW